MSRAELCWPSACSPLGLMKWLSRMPRLRASAFIMVAKASTLPATPSATTIAMSFADFTSSILSAFSSVTSCPGRTPILEGAAFEARTLTGIGVSQPMRLSRMAFSAT